MRMLRVALVIGMLALTPLTKAGDVSALYNSSCATCHAVGVLGAPKTGDKAAWAPSKARGMNVMLERVKNGYKNMPARGLCNTCTDADYEALINKMSQ